MPFCRRQTALALLAPVLTALAALGAAAGTTAAAQYSTPVGSGAAKPKTLRATAVLEWTGSLEKPSASRLMPLAVWDGEHYQPASLYLARPAPLAVETGTQYELERGGEPAGLFNVRGAAELHGEWVGMGSFHPEPAAAPPPKLKVSKHLPVLSGGKAEKGDAAATDDPGRPTLHRKTADPSSNAPPATSPGKTPASSGSSDTGAASASTTTSAGSSTTSSTDADHPTLHRRTDSADTTAQTNTGTTAGSGSTSSTGSNTGTATANPGPDPDRPTLHRKADADSDSSASTKASDPDTDRPTLHKHSDTATSSDPDRPTLHRAATGSEAASSIDPDRPRLRYGPSDDGAGSVAPVRLEGAPSTMQQLVAVSDPGPIDPRPYQYHWASPEEAAKMQAALAVLAAQAVVRPASTAAKPVARFGPASHPVSHSVRNPSGRQSSVPPAPTLVEAQVSTYELTFSGGPTVVYSAHTAEEGAARTYVTLIAQPDFSGKPQVLFQQVSRGDRLDEVPAMKLIDAIDTDGDQRAELIFQLNGATAPVVDANPDGNVNSAAPSAPTTNQPGPTAATLAAQAAAPAQPEREFAIYRVANGKAEQVFNTGPLP